MLLTFFGQLIFDQEKTVRGVELLVRQESDLNNPNADASFLFNGDFHSQSHMYSLDMQVISHLNQYIEHIKNVPTMQYVFVNFSDEILKELILSSNNSLLMKTISVLSQKLSPIRFVIEVNEHSRIRPEYMHLIIKQLRETGAMVAQDDFTSDRLEFLELNWDFIKIEQNIALSEPVLNSNNLVIEHVTKDGAKKLGNHLFQSFEFHKPQSLSDLFIQQNVNQVFV